MSEAVQSDAITIAAIRDTLCERDPYRDCVVVGSAAVVAHFYESGIPSPVGCSDVDVLCSKEYFENELVGMHTRSGISKIQVRWPKGRLAIRGATNLSLDIFPEENTTLLPFTAAQDMSDYWIRETYADAQAMAVTKAGITCKPIREIVLQIARIGRDKDIENVRRIVPPALDGHLLSLDEKELINSELCKTMKDRERHPERYYPRVPN